jgi:predicted NBD/HSP70 family sugar kinase
MSRRPTGLAMDVSDVRRHHLSLVLHQLVREGPRSRAALAQELGLTKATASALVADLLDRELVAELDTPRGGGVGRPATAVAASGSRIGGLGLQIEGDHVAACLVDLTGTVRSRHRRDGDNRDLSTARVVTRLRKVVGSVVAEADALGIDCIGATLAVPGLVDTDAVKLYVAPNLHWFDADLADVTSRIGLPGGLAVSADNEANLGALAEQRFGAARGLSSFVYVSGGIGIGAGIVTDGHLTRGAHGFGGELGHVVVDPEGRTCTCGARGCLETVAGKERLADPAIAAAALAAALRNVVHLLDPEAIVLGGTFAALGPPFAADVADRLAATTLGARWHPCEVLASTLGVDAALIGAATVALDPVLTDPTVVATRRPIRSA